MMAPSSITLWQIQGKTWKQWQNLFSWAPKSLWTVTIAIIWFLPWKESYNKPRQCFKKQRHHFANKSPCFPVVMYRCESWMIKKAEHQRMDAFKLWILDKTLERSLDSKGIKPVNPKEINAEYSLEGLILKLKY